MDGIAADTAQAEPAVDTVMLSKPPKADRQRARVVPDPADLPIQSVQAPVVDDVPEPEPVALEPESKQEINEAGTENKDGGAADEGPVVDLEARDSDTDEDDDVDLEKLRARQAAIAAAAAEEGRQKMQQWLLLKHGAHAKHPEYKGFVPSNVVNGVQALFQ